MTVRPVLTPRERRTFIRLPARLYRDDPCWVPPLASERDGQFDPDRNPFLAHCEVGLFLLEREGRPLGRIAAFIDRLAVEAWGEPIGLFGYFEVAADSPGFEAAAGAGLLLAAAEAWLRERGMERMRGPWTFVSQEWGLVIEGFDRPPVVMAPHNPPRYAAYLDSFGLRKAKDLLCWEASAPDGYRVPARILALTDRVAERNGIRTRRIDLSRFDEEVALIDRLSNETLVRNWGFSPVTAAEVRATARDLRQVVLPECVIFALDREGREIGFAITIPDVNVIIKKIGGRLLPFGWLALLRGIPRLKSYRMFGLGVSAVWRGKGVDALLYRRIADELYGPEMRMEINYVLEDNWPMVNAIAKLGPRPSRRYRVYEKALGGGAA